MWTCGPNEDSDQDGSSSSLDYIVEPFLKLELEPFRWHDILATLDVCANFPATKNWDDERYDNKLVYTFQVINKEDSSISSNQCDKET